MSEDGRHLDNLRGATVSMTAGAPIRLFGAQTGNCFRAAIALEEADVPYEVAKIDLRHGQQVSADYLKINPAGVVPAIIDYSEPDPFILTQSNAIMMYAAARSPGSLLPTLGSRQFAVVLERYFYFLMDVSAPSFDGFRLRMRRAPGRETLEQLSLENAQVSERFLETTPFMGGDTFTIADVAGLIAISAHERDIDWASRPKLRKWYETAMQRPAVQRGFKAFD